MSNYLARLKVILSETRLPREPPKGPEGAFDPFGSGHGRHVLKFEAATGAPDASLPTASIAPAPVASVEERRAAVERLLADMAAENEARRAWWREPVAGWREGFTEINGVNGETTVLRFRNRQGRGR